MSPPPLAAPSMISFCSFLSLPLAAATFSWKSSSDVIDGARAGAPLSASGALSLLPAMWKAPADFICRRPLPIQPSVSVWAVPAACQMSIERKCDCDGLG